MFGQTFDLRDLAVIGVLVVLEGILSLDNALVLGLLARPLPKHLQKRALTYGLVGAFVFRIVAVVLATWLMQMRWVKLAGGGYLIYITLEHFIFSHGKHPEAADAQLAPDGALLAGSSTGDARPRGQPGFWSTVAAIEMTDIAFAVDSILAAVGLVADRTKTWVVIIGGMLGVVLMRGAAVLFIKLLKRFPRFELSAYLLVLLIGTKLTLDWALNKDSKRPTLDFHHPGSATFWIFWGLLLICLLVGFIGGRRRAAPTTAHP
jgi:YkoY family integral membrane protein